MLSSKRVDGTPGFLFSSSHPTSGPASSTSNKKSNTSTSYLLACVRPCYIPEDPSYLVRVDSNPNEDNSDRYSSESESEISVTKNVTAEADATEVPSRVFSQSLSVSSSESAALIPRASAEETLSLVDKSVPTPYDDLAACTALSESCSKDLPANDSVEVFEAKNQDKERDSIGGSAVKNTHKRSSSEVVVISKSRLSPVLTQEERVTISLEDEEVEQLSSPKSHKQQEKSEKDGESKEREEESSNQQDSRGRHLPSIQRARLHKRVISWNEHSSTVFKKYSLPPPSSVSIVRSFSPVTITRQGGEGSDTGTASESGSVSDGRSSRYTHPPRRIMSGVRKRFGGLSLKGSSKMGGAETNVGSVAVDTIVPLAKTKGGLPSDAGSNGSVNSDVRIDGVKGDAPTHHEQQQMSLVPTVTPSPSNSVGEVVDVKNMNKNGQDATQKLNVENEKATVSTEQVYGDKTPNPPVPDPKLSSPPTPTSSSPELSNFVLSCTIPHREVSDVDKEESFQMYSKRSTKRHHGRTNTKSKSLRKLAVNSSWSRIPGSMFQVRTGPNYAKHKKKALSMDSLFDTCAVRCFHSLSRTLGIVDVLPLPLEDIFHGGEVRHYSENLDIPDVLILHFHLPSETPSMFKMTDNGKGGEVVFYLTPSRRFLDETNGTSSMSPASNLLLKWCEQCDKVPDMRGRFKAMAMARDLDRLGLGWVKPYNGKPVIINKTGSVRKGVKDGVRYIEFTGNIHAWSFLSKKSFVSLIPRFKDMRLDIGFTIEAHADSEMPECILGSTGINFLDDSSLPYIPTQFLQPGNMTTKPTRTLQRRRSSKSLKRPTSF